MKWTKREINAMTSTITSFLVHVRPVDGSRPAEFAEKLKSVLKDKRAEIISSGLQEMINLYTERLTHDRKMVAHFRDPPAGYYKPTPDVIERIENSARENEKAISWTGKLLARISSEPLPDDVVNFDPLKR